MELNIDLTILYKECCAASSSLHQSRKRCFNWWVLTASYTHAYNSCPLIEIQRATEQISVIANGSIGMFCLCRERNGYSGTSACLARERCFPFFQPGALQMLWITSPTSPSHDSRLEKASLDYLATCRKPDMLYGLSLLVETEPLTGKTSEF